MTPEETAFRESVERLYQVLAKYPLRKDTGMCPCCHDPEDEKRLHSKPLRELSPDDLESYTSSALLTWGDVEDFKHFLPRMFETINDCAPTEEVLLAKLGHGEWRTWPEDEQAAVSAYLTALWNWTLSDPENSGWDVDSILCAIAQAVDNLGPFLDEWRSTPSVVRHALLASFIDTNTDALTKHGKLRNSFWRERDSQMRRVIGWLLEPATRDALEVAYLENEDHPLALNISGAEDWLKWLSARYADRSEDS